MLIRRARERLRRPSVPRRMSMGESPSPHLWHAYMPIDSLYPSNYTDTSTYHIAQNDTISYSFHAYNIGHLSSRASNPLFTPCTPSGVISLIDSTGVSIAGKNVVVLGRSDIVGSPVAAMLRKRDATVTQCHSRTVGLEEIVSCHLILNLGDLSSSGFVSCLRLV